MSCHEVCECYEFLLNRVSFVMDANISSILSLTLPQGGYETRAKNGSERHPEVYIRRKQTFSLLL